NYRKNSEAIHHGKTIHFAPQNGIYLLSRFTENEQVVLILNKNENQIELDLNRFEELGLSGKKLINIITGEELIWNDKLTFTQRGTVLLTTKTK
ncbi:MAG: cyclomaltodextrinase C-terminal domain-containing protein, partial [Flavobacteriaceae bacterium]